MSWHFSRALVEEYLAENSLDGEPYALLSGENTPHLFSSSVKMMAFFQRSPYGMMCKPLTEDLGTGLLMWFQEASLARTLAVLAKVRELRGKDLAYGRKWPVSLGKYNPLLHTWKTAQCCLVEGLDEFSGTWPRWGLMQGGECWGLEHLEHFTTAREYGCSLTTPTCVNSKGTKPSKKFSEGRLPSVAEVAHANGGKPNPEWLEWLMGWVIGWTELKPLETDKFQQWLQQHGGF